MARAKLLAVEGTSKTYCKALLEAKDICALVTIPSESNVYGSEWFYHLLLWVTLVLRRVVAARMQKPPVPHVGNMLASQG